MRRPACHASLDLAGHFGLLRFHKPAHRLAVNDQVFSRHLPQVIAISAQFSVNSLQEFAQGQPQPLDDPADLPFSAKLRLTRSARKEDL